MDPTPKRRMLKEKTPDVLARSHPNSRARGAKKTLKANWLPQETMRIKNPATTMSQAGENMEKCLSLLEKNIEVFGDREPFARFCGETITQTRGSLNLESSGVFFPLSVGEAEQTGRFGYAPRGGSGRLKKERCIKGVEFLSAKML